MEALRSSFSNLRQFQLAPSHFMVAWNGVIVLGFEGFTETVENLKRTLKSEFPAIKENPGSKWPKVTLAALAMGRKLHESDLKTLNRIFTQTNEAIRRLQLIVETVSIVKFGCRSLERISSKQDFPLVAPVSNECPTAQQKALVQQIFSETESPNYFSLASRTGRGIAYYREDCSEWTLVAFLNGALSDEISIVRNEIEAHLPGLYEWIEASTRHVTILNLNHVAL